MTSRPPLIPACDIAPSLRPRWTVVIPVRNRTAYLRQALSGALDQDPGRDRMEILLIDNSETPVDFASLLSPSEIGRVRIHRNPAPLGMVDNWNTCLRLATGELIHLLHDDDWVAPGFYSTVDELAAAHADIHLFAVRSIHVDSDGAPVYVGPRLPSCETPSRDPSPFFYDNPLQCPGVVIKRAFYESAGGFDPRLCYPVDTEMWARAFARGGAIMSPKPLAYYRQHDANESARVAVTGEWLRDHGRLRSLFSEQYPAFDPTLYNRVFSARAFALVRKYESSGQSAAAAATRQAWKEVMPASFRFHYFVQTAVLRLLRRPLRSLRLRLDRE